MANGYLVEIDSQEREHEAVLRLFELPFIYSGFFAAFGLHSSLSWYLLEIREHHFTRAITSEIDILAGQIKLDSGRINWLQSTKYLVGIEVKCAYLDPQANQISDQFIKSKKSSFRKMNQIQSKVEELLKTGFDEVALLDIIANPPASGGDGQAWLNALDIAHRSKEAMLPVLKKRLPDCSPAGHWVWSMGSVIGGDETMRGAGAPIELRKACNNRLLEKDLITQKRRQEIQEKLNTILSGVSAGVFPLVLLDCRICGKIHGIKDSCIGERHGATQKR